MSGRALAFVATFFIPVVLARVFDQAEFGTYKQIFLIFATLYAIAPFGMAESLFYFLPVDPQNGGRYLFNASLVLIGAGLASLAALEVFGGQIARLLSNSQLQAYLIPMGFYLFFMMTSSALEIVMISRRRYLWASLSYAFSDLVRAAAFIVPALLLADLGWVLWGAVIFAAIRFFSAGFYFKREFDETLSGHTRLLKAQFKYALPFGLGVPFGILQTNFHQYAVSYYFDPVTFAIYAVGCLQIPLVDFLATPASNVMMVRMAEKIRDGRADSVLALWHDTTRKLALIFFPLVGLLLVTADELIVLLFTDSYRASVPIFMIWSSAILFAAFQTDGVIRAYARTKFALGLSILRFVLVVALIQWFLKAFGLSGAVLVTLFVMSVDKVIALVKVKSLMQVGLGEILPWRSLSGILTVSGVSGGISLLAKSGLEMSLLPLLLATGMTYAVGYICLVYGFGVLDGDEKLAISGWFARLSTGIERLGFLKDR